MELDAILSQKPEQLLPVKGGQIADGTNSKALEGLGGRPAYVEQVGDGEGPDYVPKIFPGDECGGVGIFVVAAQL